MSDFKIIYRNEPDGVRSGATPYQSDIQNFCNASDILLDNNIAPQVATFEDGYWKLGTKFLLFPDAPESETFGVWSKSKSGADGRFTAQPVLIVLLAANYSSVGISFGFDPYGPTWPADIDITWYRGMTVTQTSAGYTVSGTALGTKSFQPDGYQYSALNSVSSFNGVVIRFNSMSAADRYLKLQSIMFGIVRTFQRDDFSEIDMTQAADLNSDTAEINTIRFKVRPKDNIAYMFQDREMLRTQDGTKLMGLYYIDAHDTEGDSLYDVHGIDYVGIADLATKHLGGIYTGDVTADELIADILGNIPYILDDALKAVPMHGYLPIASKRDNLQQVAFALNAMVDTSGAEGVKIFAMKTGDPTSEFVGAKAYNGGKIATDPLVTEINLTVHAYKLGSDSSTLYDAVLTGSHKVTFSEPQGSLSVSGGTITESGANYAVITGTGSEVILTGVAYVHGTTVWTKSNSNATASDIDNPVDAEDMTLVTANNAQGILDWLYNFYLRTRTVAGKVVIGDAHPGDRVSILARDGNVYNGNLYSVKYSISATIAADVKILLDAEG